MTRAYLRNKYFFTVQRTQNPVDLQYKQEEKNSKGNGGNEPPFQAKSF